MKKLVFGVLLCTIFLGCKNDDDNGNEPSGDLETLIIGEWDDVSNGLECNGGWQFENNGVWRYVDFIDCDNPCAGIPLVGEYSITGSTLNITRGLGDVTGEITIENDVFTIIRTDLEETIVFDRLTCQ